MANYTINELHVEINHYPADKYSGNQYAIRWIVIYPVDSAIQRLNNRGLKAVIYDIDSSDTVLLQFLFLFFLVSIKALF